MKRIVPALAIIGLLGLFLLAAGCMDLSKPLKISSSQSDKTSVAAYTAKYTVGDVAIPNPNDDVGEVIQDYDPGAGRYSTRTVIFDGFGKLFFYEGGTKSMAAAEFDTKYPYKRAHIGNPYGLPTLNKAHSHKYNVDQVVTKKDAPLEGVKILSYDYQSDAYTYVYAYKNGLSWNYGTTSYTAARTDLEKRYG
jgi:hypothetical protein